MKLNFHISTPLLSRHFSLELHQYLAEVILATVRIQSTGEGKFKFSLRGTLRDFVFFLDFKPNEKFNHKKKL